MIASLALSSLLMLGGATARTIQYDTVVGDFSAFKGGLYESAFDNKTNSLYVTSASAGNPTNVSDLLKVNGDSLKIESDFHAGKTSNSTSVLAVYGVNYDAKNNLVWVSNTRQDTVSAHKADNLSDFTEYPAGTVNHPFDVWADPKTDNVYSGGARDPVVTVYNAKNPNATVKHLNISEITGKNFTGVMAFVVDQETRTLYTASLRNPRAAAINLDDHSAQVYELGNVTSSTGVAIDTKRKHLYIANQVSNTTVVVDTKSGKVIKSIPVPGQPLSAVYEPIYDVVYVACRAGSKISVIDAADYSSITELSVDVPNHIALGSKGAIYVTDKSKKSALYKFTPRNSSNATNSSSHGNSSSHSNSTSTAHTANSGAVYGVPVVAGAVAAAAAMFL